MITLMIVLAFVVLLGVAAWLWLTASEPPPPPRPPLNPEAVVRLGRIQAARQAQQIKNQVDRNIQFVRREALRQMRDL